MRLQAAAERYAEQGWRIFPLQVRGKRPWGNTEGLLEATSDLAQIRDWWTYEPNANIGCVPGPRHLVADLDTETSRIVANGLGLLEIPTLTCETGRAGYKGQHLYFQHPGGDIGNKRLAIIHGALTLVDGKTPALEIKADHGYVVVPPSIHPSGRQYRWESHEEIQPLPEQAKVAILHERSAKPAIGDVIFEGSRDDSLIRLAGAWRRLGVGEDIIETALQAVNRHHVRPPLPEHVVTAKAKSIARYPAGEPQQKPSVRFLPRPDKWL